MMLAETPSPVKPQVNIIANKHLAETMSHIGPRLAAAREKAGLTQEAAARMLGVHAITLSRWEGDKQGVKAVMLHRIAALYHTTVDAILSENAKEPSPGRTVSENVSRGTVPAPRHARNLPLAVREYLAEFQLRLVKGGASEEEIDEAMRLLKSPDVFTYFKGGRPTEFNEEDVLNGMRAIGEDVIIPRLKKLGRKVK